MAQSLFTSETPAGSFSDGAPGIVTATTLNFAVDGEITHVRFYAASGTLSGTWTGAVWEVTADDTGNGGAGTLLASKTTSGAGVTPGAWNTIALDTPVPVTAGPLYRIGLHTPEWYVVTNNFFLSGGLVNGDVIADVRTGSRHQGAFAIDAGLIYPNLVGSSASYFVDVVFQEDGGDPATEVTATLSLPALQASAVLASRMSAAMSISLPALQATAVLASRAVAASAASLPALQMSAVVSSRAALAAALTLPRLALAAVLSSPEAPAEDTSSPNAPISTSTRPFLVATISRERVISTGSAGGT